MIRPVILAFALILGACTITTLDEAYDQDVLTSDKTSSAIEQLRGKSAQLDLFDTYAFFYVFKTKDKVAHTYFGQTKISNFVIRGDEICFEKLERLSLHVPECTIVRKGKNVNEPEFFAMFKPGGKAIGGLYDIVDGPEFKAEFGVELYEEFTDRLAIEDK